jgi:transposase-like protein
MSRTGRPRNLNNMVCQNPYCRFYQIIQGKDIRKQGKNSAGHQRFQCGHCKSYCVNTANTPLYHRHVSEKTLILLGKMLIEKMGNRAISRVLGLTRVTVARLITNITLHALEFNALMIKKVKVGPVELDEMWDFIKKNKRMWTPAEIAAISKVTSGSIIVSKGRANS